MIECAQVKFFEHATDGPGGKPTRAFGVRLYVHGEATLDEDGKLVQGDPELVFERRDAGATLSAASQAWSDIRRELAWGDRQKAVAAAGAQAVALVEAGKCVVEGVEPE